MNKRNIYHFDIINQFNQETYGEALFSNNIIDDEIAIKNKDIEELEYFIPMKKNGVNYLLPSEKVEGLPIIPTTTRKIAYKGKAYLKIIHCEDLRIRPLQTSTYKEMINSWLDIEHEEKELFTLHKIIVDTARVSRINVRIITYPGWMKDSPLTILGLLFGDCVTVNKPTMAKLKYLLPNNKVIGLNEVNKVTEEKKDDLSQYYEDTGDFKPVWENPSRAISGAMEKCDLKNSSSMTFYNFPDENEVVQRVLFDFLFHSKVKSRIFPLLFKGGGVESDGTIRTACKESFSHQVMKITCEESDTIRVFLKNMAYYEVTYPNGREKWNRNLEIFGTRWNRNFKTILSRIDLYCESQEEFDKFEKLLYDSHKAYLDYVYSL